MNIQDNRETANKAVRERTIGLLDDCMPQNARNFYAYIFKYIMNPDSVADDQTAFSDYDQLAAECIFYHAMIKVDSSTGEIKETKTPDGDCIFIKTDDLGESFESMPSSMKCVLNDLINQIVASGIDTPLADQDRIALQNLALLVTKTVYVYSLLFVPEYLEQLYKRIVIEGGIQQADGRRSKYQFYSRNVQDVSADIHSA